MSSFTNIIETQTSCDHSLTFVVEGKAHVQRRPKVSFRNKKAKFIYYDPSSVDKKNWKTNFNDALITNGINVPVFGSDPRMFKGIHLSMDIYVSRPKSDYHVVKGIQVIKSNPHLFPNIKDIDNMLKFYMDAMQDVAYSNDNVITRLSCSKNFLDDSKTESTKEPYIVFTMNQNK
jgi:Holliday junction resolvase RusA-like endonuclease